MRPAFLRRGLRVFADHSGLTSLRTLCDCGIRTGPLGSPSIHNIMAAYAQPHPRLSVLSTTSQSSSTDHLSPTSSSTRFSIPSAPTAASNKSSAPRPNIYDRNLNKTRVSEVSASAFSFLFSEVVQYTQKRVSGINDLERRYIATPYLSSHHPHFVPQVKYAWVSDWDTSLGVDGLACRIII